jgi:hypothetical protein
MKEAHMTNPRTLAICAVGFLLLTHGVDGQDRARYRDFELGSNLASVAGLTGVALSQAKTIHQRPAVLQDLEWRLSTWIAGSTVASTDPVEQIVFSFYNDQLFRIVVDYEHDRTEGMTDADMIDAVAAVYGVPVKRTIAPVRLASRIEAESGTQVARWADAAHSVALFRTSSYRGAFRLIVTESALDALAQKATLQAVRLDDQEAPRREVARLKKEQDDGRAAAEKARNANKKVFRP